MFNRLYVAAANLAQKPGRVRLLSFGLSLALVILLGEQSVLADDNPLATGGSGG
ncbi:MAG: hypothetical protein GYB66_05115 [Chloroflexi bacterium]|jgi:hypothetical protein|nr:hypothetical protein [Chloroflexota bacterium]